MSEGQQHHIALPAGYRLENYRLEAVLGHGGFGLTYRSVDEDLRDTVAIKEYLPREVAFRDRDSTIIPLSESDREIFEWGLERFLDEARTLARFRHPNIVGVRRFIRANGTAYLVMDYCAGESLESVLAREGTLVPERLGAMLVPLLNALEALHAAGVTHRDIKPGNIYLREDGSPVLLDFGAARQALAQHSRSVTAMATPGYAAFEQYSTKGKQGPWTDLYGLGATLYRCVTGERPPDASDRMLEDELVSAVEAGSGRYPRPLLGQIDAALQLRPGDRPQSIKDWRRLAKLESVSRSRPTILPPPGRRDDWRRSETASTGAPSPDPLIEGRYQILGAQGEIVRDTVTGLEWQRCSLGQTWDGHRCVGEAQTFTWQQAREAVDLLSDWRLPTIDELKTLIYCSSGQPDRFGNGHMCKGAYWRPTIVQEAFPNTPSSDFWSGSPSARNSYYAWYVSFNGGYAYHSYWSDYDRVRLVRGGE